MDETASTDIDPGIDQEQMRRLAARADDGPVHMLNLLRFRAEGGRGEYGRYLAEAGDLVEQVGGRVLSAGLPAERIIGGQVWDLVLVVEYPTRRAFLDLVTSDAYRAIEHLRHESLERSVLYALDPIEVGR